MFRGLALTALAVLVATAVSGATYTAGATGPRALAALYLGPDIHPVPPGRSIAARLAPGAAAALWQDRIDGWQTLLAAPAAAAVAPPAIARPRDIAAAVLAAARRAEAAPRTGPVPARALRPGAAQPPGWQMRLRMPDRRGAPPLEDASVVPLPPAVWMMLTGLGCLALLGRRRTLSGDNARPGARPFPVSAPG